MGNETTQNIPIEKGLRQGFILSSLLSNPYSEAIFVGTEAGIKISWEVVNNIRFTNDSSIHQVQVLISEAG